MKKLAVFLLALVLLTKSFAQVDSLLESAKFYYDNQQIQQAMYNYVKVLSLEPSNVDALIGMGDCVWTMGDTAEALNYYLKALKTDTVDFKAYKALGNFYLKTGKYSKAQKVFEKAYQLNPNKSQVLAWLGVSYMHLNNLDTAQIFFDKAIKLSKDPVNIYQLLAWSYSSIERFDSAIAYINKAIDLQPKNDSLYFIKAEIEIARGQYSQALTDLDKAIELNPKNSKYYLEKLTIYIYMSDYADAVKFGKKLAFTLADSNFYYFLTYAMIQQDLALDTVKIYLQKGIEQTQAASLYYLLGLVYQMQQNLTEAYNAFKKAVDKDPWEIKYYREMVTVKLLINSKDLDKNLLFKTFTQKNLPKLKKLAKSKRSEYYYPTLVQKFQNDPLSLGLDQYIMLYIGQSLQKKYSPANKETNYLTVKNLLSKGKVLSAITEGQKLKKSDISNIGLYYELTLANYYKSDLKGFRQNYVPYLGFALAILSTGKGTSQKDALISTAQIDELMVLNFISYDQFDGQEKIKDKKHHYNVYHISKDGKHLTYYFNTDLYYKFYQ